jgi:hypothetical protein
LTPGVTGGSLPGQWFHLARKDDPPVAASNVGLLAPVVLCSSLQLPCEAGRSVPSSEVWCPTPDLSVAMTDPLTILDGIPLGSGTTAPEFRPAGEQL